MQLLGILTCFASELILRKSLKVINPRCVYYTIINTCSCNYSPFSILHIQPDGGYLPSRNMQLILILILIYKVKVAFVPSIFTLFFKKENILDHGKTLIKFTLPSVDIFNTNQKNVLCNSFVSTID